jgi:serine/threonine protein kinase
MPFIAGENVGSYRIIEKLGQGGMATVYKAYHPALDRYVAIKVLHPAFKEDPHFLERFRREARVVARLEHPNIVPIYDFAEHEGQPYLVMKYIEGETLKARLHRNELSESEGNKVIDAVGKALSYAHREGVLHRDVKPSNILLSDQGKVFLTDFGLARIAEAGASTLTGDMLMGTPQYISPEQARGEKNLDERTDIYSFGIVLYEIVVGRVPFSADTPFSIIHDHIYTPLPLPCEINPSVSATVQNVLLKALAKDPKDRYSSGDELVEAYFRAASYSGAEVVGVDWLSETRSIDKKVESVPETRTAEAFPESPVETEEVTEKPPERKAVATKRSLNKKWIWMACGIFIMCVALFGFIAIANQSGIRTLFNQDDSDNLGIEETLERTTSDAINNANAVINENPDNPDAYAQLARAYLDEGRKEDAGIAFAEAGRLYFGQGEYLEGVIAFNEAIALQGGIKDADPQIVEMVVQILFLTAPEEIFRPIFERTIEKFPAWDIPKVIEARSFLYKGQFEMAKTLLDETLSVNPDNFRAKAILAEYYFMQGMNDEALALVKELQNVPRIPEWLKGHLINLEQDIRSKME